MLKIESYEPYHIGIKLNPYVDLDILKGKIRDALVKKKYEIAKELPNELTKIGTPKEVLAVKNDTKVELNFGARALNVIGDMPSNVIRVFEELSTVLPKIGYDLDAAALFFEILANIIIKSDKKPIEIINKSVRVDLESLKEIKNVATTGILITSPGASDREGLFNLIIEPSPSSPNNRFSVKVQYRLREIEKIKSFTDKLESKITEIIQSLGGG